MSVFLVPENQKKVWWYRFVYKGRLIRKSTRQANYQAAVDMENAHKTALAKGTAGIFERKPVPTLAEFLTKRIEPWAKVRPSWTWFRSGIQPLVAHNIRRMDLDSITTETIAGYAADRQAQGLKTGSINRELRVLRRVLRLAAEWGVIPQAPKVKMHGPDGRRERVVSDDEFERYLTSATPLLAEVAIVLHDTGLRPDECHRLDWADINFTTGRHGAMLIRCGKTKAARRRLPLTARVRTVLAKRWEEHGRPEEGWIFETATKTGHIDHSTVKKAHRKALKLSRVRPFLLYNLRHSFATRIAPHVDAWTLCKIMGWASLSVAMVYVHASEDQVLAAFSDLGSQENGQGEDSRLLADGTEYVEVL
jgi:integrase